jgi:serine/threonine protein phosphatase PrpC
MPPNTIEQRGRATVGYMKGHSHAFYEDRFRLLTKEVPLVADAARGELLAVFDGIGGLRVGMHAAQHMADLLVEFFEEPTKHAPDQDGLRALLVRGSQEIRLWGDDSQTGKPMGGCVGTVAWFNRERACLFHLGDSEGWISTKPGQAEKITETHSFGRALTQFYGSAFDPKIQAASFDFKLGMRLLLASDGLRNAGLVDDMINLVGERLPPRQAVEAICTAAISARAYDDVTALLVI